MILLMISILSFLSPSSSAWAQAPAKKILAAAPETSQHTFAKFLKENPRFKSIAHHLAIENDASEFQTKIVQGQNHFLQGSMARAIALFKQVAQSRHTKDWAPKQRQRILYALFRLAQLTEGEGQQRVWIKKALGFSMDTSPEPRLFPPPLLETWRREKKNIAIRNYVLPKNFENFSLLKINGQPVDTAHGLFRSHNQIQRFSFYSNSYRPFFWVGRPSELENVPLPQQPLFQGSCRDYSTTLPKAIDGALFPGACLKTQKPETAEAIIKTRTKDFSKKPSRFWKKNRTLVILGSVALGSLVAWQTLRNSNSAAKSPSNAPGSAVTETSARAAQPILISNQN